MRRHDGASTGETVHLGQLHLAERGYLLIGGIVERPLDGRIAATVDADVARAVVVANGVPRCRVFEVKHPALVILTSEPGAEHRPHPWAQGGAFHEVTVSVDGLCPVEG